MYFEIIGNITDIEPIAIGSSIRQLEQLRKQYGEGRWRKLKGKAVVRLKNGRIRKAEVHSLVRGKRYRQEKIQNQMLSGYKL